MHYFFIALFTILLAWTPALASVEVTPGIHEENGSLKYVAVGNKFEFGGLSIPFDPRDTQNCANLQIFFDFFAAGLQGESNVVVPNVEIFKQNVLHLRETLVDLFPKEEFHPFLFRVMGLDGVEKIIQNPSVAFTEAMKHINSLNQIVRKAACSCSQVAEHYECLFPSTLPALEGISIPELLIFNAQATSNFRPAYFSNINFEACQTMSRLDNIRCSVQKIKEGSGISTFPIIPENNGPQGSSGLKITSSEEENADFIPKVPFFIFFISALLALG